MKAPVPFFPLFAPAYVDVVDSDVSSVGFQQVENEAEEGGLSRTVVAHQPQHVALMDGIILNVDGNLAAEVFLKVCNLYHLVYWVLAFVFA